MARQVRGGKVMEPDDGSPARALATHIPVDELMDQLSNRSQDDPGRERYHRLLEVKSAIVNELDLAALLKLVVRAARDFSGARYAALGVIGDDGLFEDFVHVGMETATVREIGRLPRGLGLLSVPSHDQSPQRVADISGDSRSTGFPAGHPRMGNFLGVSILSDNEVFGTLYLADREGGDFTADDEALMLSLAATAGFAVSNARMHAESNRRERWLKASVDISTALLTPSTDQEALQLIATEVRLLADADLVSIVLPTRDRNLLQVEVADGVLAERLVGLRYTKANTLAGLAMDTSRGARVQDLQSLSGYSIHLRSIAPIGPTMAVPLSAADSGQGAVVVGRLDGRPAFSTADLEMAEAFATHAAIARKLSAARADHQRLAVLEDRERIALDLHDHVIQRLFAVGLTLQGSTEGLSETSHRINHVIDDVDDIIDQIRASIFRLRGSDGDPGLRLGVLSVVDQLSLVLGFEPTVLFAGALDTPISPDLVSDVEAVVRESLTNAARHSGATTVSVKLSIAHATLVLDVVDNGSGIGATTRRSGLANMARRAQVRQGQLVCSNAANGGTHLVWSVPIQT